LGTEAAAVRDELAAQHVHAMTQRVHVAGIELARRIANEHQHIAVIVGMGQRLHEERRPVPMRLILAPLDLIGMDGRESRRPST
jgi:hypothetical protein